MPKIESVNTKYLLLLVLLTFFVGCVGCDINFGSFARVKSERTEQLSAPMAEGSILTAETEVGSITISGSETTECSVTAEITARAPTQAEADKLAGQVKIKLKPEGDDLRLYVEKPEHKRKRIISVDFDITIPIKTNLHLENNVGDIEVSNISGAIYATTDVGGITCSEIAGNVELEVDVGDVTAEYCDGAGSRCG